jgi:hypothetical protein
MTVTEKRIEPGEEGWLSRPDYPAPNSKVCLDRRPDGGVGTCRRYSGHEGDHAYSFSHYGQLVQVATWPQEPEHPVIEGYEWCDDRGFIFVDGGFGDPHSNTRCPGPHYTVLRGDLLEPPHTHEWKRLGSMGAPFPWDYDPLKVLWFCATCDERTFTTTQAPKPEGGL